MSNFSELKKYLKEKAESISLAKKELKDFQKGHNGYDGGYFKLIKEFAYEYRHHHIAYCLMRGKEYEVIEKSHENNKPNFNYIEEIRGTFYENVCISTK